MFNSPEGKSKIEKMEMEIDDTPKPKGTPPLRAVIYLFNYFSYTSLGFKVVVDYQMPFNSLSFCALFS